MKKLLLLITSLSITVIMQAQTNPIDEMFNKYSEREGFTLVTISSKMFSMFANLDKENKDADNVISHLKSIRILSVEDSLLNINLNFYTELSKKLDLSVYEDLVMSKTGHDITRIMIRQKGDIISELLVVTGGPGGNSLISIKGDLNLKNISDISKSIDIQELKGLEKVDEKTHKE
jgi:hypothetical protein